MQREWGRVFRDSPWLALVVDRHCSVIWQSDAVARVLTDPLPVVVADNTLKPNAREVGHRMTQFFDNLTTEPTRIMIGDDEGRHWVLLRGWLMDDRKDWTACVHVVCSKPLRRVRDTEMPELFGLTPAEALVLEKTAELKKPRTIAEELKVTESTIRSHLKQLHTKLEVVSSRQLLLKARAFCDT